MQCSEEGTDLYTGDTRQQLHKRNTGEPALQVKTQMQLTNILRRRDTDRSTHLRTERSSEKTDGYREESRKPPMLNWKKRL